MLVKTMTVRNIPEDVAERLNTLARERGQSMNATVVALLRESVGGAGPLRKKRDLSAFCGVWADAEAREFEEAVAAFDEIDVRDWQ